MKAPLPDNEAQRLEALLEYKILDTPSEKAFDDLTRLAAYICGTPICLITLVDAERQWFKSKVGLEASQTPRDLAFCAHAILQPDPFIVPDATKDERFATNPLVTSDPYVRFYAGVPLITPEKQAIGTLCIIDHVPRNLTPEQLEALRILSRQAIQQLELRRNLANLTLQVTERQRVGKKRKRFFRRIAGGIGLASAILTIVGGVSYQSLTGLIETNNLAAQTQERLTKLEGLLSQVKDAETGQRGYLLTGEEYYLEPYKTAIANLDREIEELKELTANYPNQHRQLDALESLIKNKLVELKGTIDLRQGQGLEAALDLVRTNLGKKIMDDIRQSIQELENEEKAILKQQVSAAQVSTRRAIFTLLGGLFLTFLILCLVFYLIYREIKERQWVEEALNKERNFIGAVLDTSSALVLVLDRFGKIVRFNQACEQISGYSFDQVRGRHFWNLFLIPEEVEPVKAIFAQLQAGQFPSENENYWVTKDGSRRLIAWSNTALLDSQGLVEYVIGTGIDITERKQAEEALIESETKYRLVVDNLKEVIFQTDTAKRLMFLNPAWTEITGYSVAESLGKRFLDFFHSDDSQLHWEKFLTLIQGQTEDCRYSVRCKTKRGDIAQIEVYAHRTLADDGTLLGISGTLNDITERKRREQHLKAETATTRVLAEADTLSEAIPKILQAICQSLGWERGEFWSVDNQGKELRCIETWQLEFFQVSEFEAATAQVSFVLGEGLPGRVWASGEPSWMSNVVENPDFLRGAIAAKVGLHAAFGFPILAGDETLGIMTFFSQE
ncbi:MAG: PAS domain S-box protein, partial [Cyanobacteriota bacterium]